MFIDGLRAPPCVLGLVLFILGPEEGSNQMGKQKNPKNPLVSYGFGYSSGFQTQKKKEFLAFTCHFAWTFNYNLKAFFMNRWQCKFQIKPDADLCSPGTAARLTNNPTVCPKAAELNENLWSAENERIPHKLQLRNQHVAFIHRHLSNRRWKLCSFPEKLKGRKREE